MTLDELEELYDEARAKLAAFFTHYDTGGPAKDEHHATIKQWPADYIVSAHENMMSEGQTFKPEALVVNCYHAAKLYVIARDEGMDAAMLWKLANGGAQ